MNLVYIVICFCPLERAENGRMFGSDENYHVDSVWTSRRKAHKRKKHINSDEKAEWREDYGFGIFEVQQEIVSH